MCFSSLLLSPIFKILLRLTLALDESAFVHYIRYSLLDDWFSQHAFFLYVYVLLISFYVLLALFGIAGHCQCMLLIKLDLRLNCRFCSARWSSRAKTIFKKKKKIVKRDQKIIIVLRPSTYCCTASWYNANSPHLYSPLHNNRRSNRHNVFF